MRVHVVVTPGDVNFQVAFIIAQLGKVEVKFYDRDRSCSNVLVLGQQVPCVNENQFVKLLQVIRHNFL